MIEPIIALVLITALVSACNPYTIGVLIMLCSVIYGRGRGGGRVFSLGAAFILTLCAASILGGIALLYLWSLLPLIASTYLALGIGILIVCAGLLEIKDFFWYGQGISHTSASLSKNSIKSLTKTRPTIGTAIVLGLFVAVVSTPSSSAPYFATITLLRGSFDLDAISLLVLYSVIFALPMIAVLVAAANGMRVATLLRWVQDAKRPMRLSAGLLLIALGWTIMLASSGVVHIV